MLVSVESDNKFKKFPLQESDRTRFNVELRLPRIQLPLHINLRKLRLRITKENEADVSYIASDRKTKMRNILIDCLPHDTTEKSKG